MKTWTKYGLMPYSKCHPTGVFAILMFSDDKLHPLLVNHEGVVVGEVTKVDAIEMAIDAGMSNIIIGVEPDSIFGPRPHGYPRNAAMAWFVDADSARRA